MTTGNRNEIIRENRRKYIIKSVTRENMGKRNTNNGRYEWTYWYSGGKIDKNGELLLTFTEENDLEIGNITIARGKVTWRRTGGKEKSAIDFVLMNDQMKYGIRGNN